jgi:hypothetical protein
LVPFFFIINGEKSATAYFRYILGRLPRNRWSYSGKMFVVAFWSRNAPVLTGSSGTNPTFGVSSRTVKKFFPVAFTFTNRLYPITLSHLSVIHEFAHLHVVGNVACGKLAKIVLTVNRVTLELGST